MDSVDKDLEKAERDASPNRFQQFTPAGEAIERVATGSSSASSNSSTSSRNASGSINMARQTTEHDVMSTMERSATSMSRIQTQRSQHSGTVGASAKSRRSNKSLPAFGAGKPYPAPLPDREEYVVEFDGDNDPLHAQNWSTGKKLRNAAMLGWTTFLASFGSSIFSAATSSVAKVFGVSTEVGTLGVSLYVLGFAFGPVCMPPNQYPSYMEQLESLLICDRMESIINWRFCCPHLPGNYRFRSQIRCNQLFLGTRKHLRTQY